MDTEITNSEPHKIYDVLASTGDIVIIGKIRYRYEQRLIDALNEGVPLGVIARGIDFLPLTEADIYDASGKISHHSTLYLSKGNIDFVAQVSGESHRKRFTSFPYREKVPVEVKFLLTRYQIRGWLHVDTWGKLGDAIESAADFLPLTNVEVEPALPGEHKKFEFVAVNRRRITYLHENSL